MGAQSSRRNVFISHLLVLLGYLGLTGLLTWPVAWHLAEAIPGDGFDGWQNYWNLWWVRQAVLVLGQNPYETDYLYPPHGTNLYFHTLNIFNGLWTLPIQLNLGLALAYNSVVFFSFVLTGYGGYLLCRYVLARLKLTHSAGVHLAAFAGGVVFTMSPFHMAHLLGHMQVFSMVWPPFYVLWLVRLLQPWHSLSPRFAGRDVALCGLFLVLASLVDWYHTLYLLLFTGLALVWKLGYIWRAGEAGTQPFQAASRGRSPFRRLRAGAEAITPSYAMLYPVLIVAAIGLGFVIVMSPLLAPMIREAGRRPDLETGLSQNITLSADLLAFVTPSELHPLWGGWARRLADNFTTTTSERLIFAGFGPLILGVFVVIRRWREPLVKFWASIVLIFFVLALGPYLHIGGQMVKIGEWALPMPYLLLYHTVPFLDLTRSLSRYDLMVMLALGVLVAIALASLANYRSGSAVIKPGSLNAGAKLPLANYYIPFLLLLICFEFLVAPYPLSKIEIPPFYYEMANDPDPYTIAELPMNWDRPTPLLHQTVHGRRLLTAYTSRNNPRELAWRTPVLQHWRNLGPDIITQPLDLIAPTIFYDFNLRYIVLDYWQMPPGPEREGTERWLAAALPGALPIYDDGRLKVYQSPPKTETQPYLSLGEGWGGRDVSDEGIVSRNFVAGGDRPELFLHHPQGRSLKLELVAAGNSPQTTVLKLQAGREVVATIELRPGFSRQQIQLPAFSGELIKLTFITEPGGGVITVREVDLVTLGIQTETAHFEPVEFTYEALSAG